MIPNMLSAVAEDCDDVIVACLNDGELHKYIQHLYSIVIYLQLLL